MIKLTNAEINEVMWDISGEEALKNAQLAEAFPEIIKNLEKIYEFLDKYDFSDPSDPELVSCVELYSLGDVLNLLRLMQEKFEENLSGIKFIRKTKRGE